MAKQPGTQLNSNAISPRLQINFPTRLSGVNAPLGGRLRFFHKNWNMITSDPYILEIVQGYKLDLVEIPFQAFTPKPLLFSKSETKLLDNEIRDFARQKRHSSGATHPRTVYQYRVCRAKKGRRNKACNKSKGSEPVSELPPF